MTPVSGVRNEKINWKNTKKENQKIKSKNIATDCLYFWIQKHILLLCKPGIRETTWYPASFISMHHFRIVVCFFQSHCYKTRSSVSPRILMNPIVSCRPLNALVSSSYSGCTTLTFFSAHLRIEMSHGGSALAIIKSHNPVISIEDVLPLFDCQVGLIYI